MKRRKKDQLPEISEIPPELLENAFPGGFTIRDEANALTAYAFRNGSLEDLHADKSSELTSDPSLSRITDDEMKDLMIEASEKFAAMLEWKEANPSAYKTAVQVLGFLYCRAWERYLIAGDGVA